MRLMPVVIGGRFALYLYIGPVRIKLFGWG